MDELTQGLIISLLGVVITFLALGSLVLLIWLLRAVFPPVRRGEAVAESAPQPPQADKEREVAIIAAAWYWQHRAERLHRSDDLGSRLERGPSPWWHAGTEGEEGRSN